MCRHIVKVFVSRTRLSEEVASPPRGSYAIVAPRSPDLRAWVDRRIEVARGGRSRFKMRADTVKAIAITIPLPLPLNPDDAVPFFEFASDALAASYDEANVIYSAVIGPHDRPALQFAFVPLTGDGRLSSHVIRASDINRLSSYLEAYLEGFSLPGSVALC